MTRIIVLVVFGIFIVIISFAVVPIVGNDPIIIVNIIVIIIIPAPILTRREGSSPMMAVA